MNPQINTGYQDQALYGDTPNASALDATMLNPAATGPNDWVSVLTNGISGAAVAGVQGMVQNAVDEGQIKNAQLAGSSPVTVIRTPINPMHLLLLGALIFVVVHA